MFSQIIAFTALALIASPFILLAWAFSEEVVYERASVARDKQIESRRVRREVFEASYNRRESTPVVQPRAWSISDELALTEIDATPVCKSVKVSATQIARDMITLAGLPCHKTLAQRKHEASQLALETFNARLPELEFALDTLDQDTTEAQFNGELTRIVQTKEILAAWTRYCLTSDTICHGLINQSIASTLGFQATVKPITREQAIISTATINA
jgi:hypothetical protein